MMMMMTKKKGKEKKGRGGKEEIRRGNVTTDSVWDAAKGGGKRKDVREM